MYNYPGTQPCPPEGLGSNPTHQCTGTSPGIPCLSTAICRDLALPTIKLALAPGQATPTDGLPLAPGQCRPQLCPPAGQHTNSRTLRALQPENLGHSSTHQWAGTSPRTPPHLPVGGNESRDHQSTKAIQISRTALAPGPPRPWPCPSVGQHQLWDPTTKPVSKLTPALRHL